MTKKNKPGKSFNSFTIEVSKDMFPPDLMYISLSDARKEELIAKEIISKDGKILNKISYDLHILAWSENKK